jgi:exportin-2 (importin alpha re-exporter)
VRLALFSRQKARVAAPTRDPPRHQPPQPKRACRYLYLFRSRLPKAKLLAAFPVVMRLLQADSNVVHSYAAIVLERLLALRVPAAAGAAAAQQPLLVPADVSGHLPQLFQLLFSTLGKPDSTENEYVMRCVMRVIMFVGPQIVPVAQGCLDWCAAIPASVAAATRGAHPRPPACAPTRVCHLQAHGQAAGGLQESAVRGLQPLPV